MNLKNHYLMKQILKSQIFNIFIKNRINEYQTFEV